MSWLQSHPQGVILKLQIQPRSSKSAVVGIHGDRLKIRIAAPPVEGEANEELLRFLRKSLDLGSSSLELLRGHASRSKDVLCRGLTAEEIEARLKPRA